MVSAIEPITALTGAAEAGLGFGDLIIPWAEIERIVWREGDAIFHTRPGVGMSIFGVRVPGVAITEEAWRRYIADVAPTVAMVD